MLFFIKKIGLLALTVFAFTLTSSNSTAMPLQDARELEKFVEVLPSSEQDSSRQALIQLYDAAQTYSIDFQLLSVSYNSEVGEGVSTMEEGSSCTVRAKITIAGQEAEVTATAPTCVEAYQMLKDMFGNMVP